jgi:mono/diheme cytochrome c family protein
MIRLTICRILFASATLFGLVVRVNAKTGMPLDGEEVYQNNCSRCHRAIHTFPPRMIATVTRHMQVRATLTREERAAVLQYLLESATKSTAAKKVSR